MQTVIKLAVTLAVILICTQIGKRFSSLAGLIAVMPLTGLLIFAWLYPDVAKAGGLQSQGVKGEVVVIYYEPLTTPDLKFSGFPEG